MASDGYVDQDAVLRAFDDSPGIQLVVRAPDLRVVAANRGARDAFQRGALLGVSLTELRDPGLQGVVTALTQAVRTGTVFHDEQLALIADWPNPASGIWLDLTVNPWRDEHGTVVGAVAAGIDVTTRLRAAQLERSGAATADQRLARAREVVLRLQGALLPSTVPLLPRVDVAASYLVAGLEQAAGGDWFDSATLPDGRVSLTVGDVVGHGVEASAIMSQLRAVLAARLLEGAGILSALEAVEAFAGRVSGAFAATLCVALLDPHTGDLEYATRGHPAPLVVGPDGARVLPTTGDGPLGARTEGRVATATLRDGDAIVLFTDGLVESVHRPLLDGLGALERTALDAYRDASGGTSVASRICQQVPPVLIGDGFTDDVTVLAAHRRQAPAPLELSVPAEPGQLARVRAAVDTWGLHIGLGSRDRSALVLGVSEVMANAVEHAYRDTDSAFAHPVEVRARIRADAIVEVVVRDHGRWREPDRDPGERGRGFSMMASAGLQVAVETGPDGTVVTLECPARRPAPVDQADAVSDAANRADAPLVLRSEADEGHVVLVGGAVDHRSAAAQVEAEILRLSRNGLVPVTVDLGDVAYLGSAGVRVLESLLRTTRRLQVVAPPGTPAAQTLEVAGTPFLPSRP
jgi:serine phosphatase RsbU (regulator of sigma subunit)/anti-sigma regulatory factor (Ser/Thr protein kinase)